MCDVAVVSMTVPFVAGLDRARATSRGGYIHQYDTAKNKRNKSLIQAAYTRACLEQYGMPMKAQSHVPVTLRIETYRELPKSRPKSVNEEPDTYTPDADNEAKLILDALNGVAWVDDAQVNRLVVYKHDRIRGIEPHTEATIMFEWMISDEDTQ